MRLAVALLALVVSAQAYHFNFDKGWEEQWKHSTDAKYLDNTLKVESPPGLSTPALKVWAAGLLGGSRRLVSVITAIVCCTPASVRDAWCIWMGRPAFMVGENVGRARLNCPFTSARRRGTPASGYGCSSGGLLDKLPGPAAFERGRWPMRAAGFKTFC